MLNNKNALSDICQAFLADGFFTLFTNAVMPVASAATTLANWPVAAVALIGYLGLEGTKAWKAAKTPKQQELLIKNILNQSDADAKKIKEIWHVGIEAELDRRQIIERCKRLQNVSASIKGQLDDMEEHQRKDINVLRELIEEEFGKQTKAFDDFLPFLENRFYDLQEEIRKSHKTLYDELILLLVHRPPLYKRTCDIDKSRQDQNLFNYRYQWIPFVGRKVEQEIIERFLLEFPDKKVLWYPIIGDGGSGKSRLALEICLSWEQKGWYTGFIDSAWIEKHHMDANWTPTRPTLIIVDYASQSPETLGKYISNYFYQSQEKSWPHPVRFILLERNIENGWLERLMFDEREVLKNTCYVFEDKKEIRLEGLTDEDTWAIFESIYTYYQKEIPKKDQKQSILRSLKEITEKALPLYTAFTADALGRGEKINDWSKNGLSSLILKHYQKIWKAHGIDGKTEEGQKSLLSKITFEN